MIEYCFARTSVITRLRLAPLGSHLDALTTTLSQHGYAPDSIRRTLRAGDQFGRWLAQHGYAIAEVDEALVERYMGFQEHSPSCGARHDGSHPEYRIMPSNVGERIRGAGFIGGSSA